MSNRKKISPKTQTEVLLSSRRRCAICYGLFGNTEEKKGQIAHFDRDNSNNSLENLVFLCLEHHDQYDSRTSQSKGLTIEEVKKFRAQLYDYVATNLPASTMPTEEVVDMEIRDDSFQSDFTQKSQQSQFSAISKLAKEIGISEKQLAEDLEAVSILAQKVDEAGLSRTQMRILALIVENVDYSEVPRRVVESGAHYDYLSHEFFSEMKVLEHRKLAYIDEDDGNIHLSIGDEETLQLIKYLSKLKEIDILEFLKDPRVELLLYDED